MDHSLYHPSSGYVGSRMTPKVDVKVIDSPKRTQSSLRLSLRQSRCKRAKPVSSGHVTTTPKSITTITKKRDAENEIRTRAGFPMRINISLGDEGTRLESHAITNSAISAEGTILIGHISSPGMLGPDPSGGRTYHVTLVSYVSEPSVLAFPESIRTTRACSDPAMISCHLVLHSFCCYKFYIPLSPLKCPHEQSATLHVEPSRHGVHGHDGGPLSSPTAE